MRGPTIFRRLSTSLPCLLLASALMVIPSFAFAQTYVDCSGGTCRVRVAQPTRMYRAQPVRRAVSAVTYPVRRVLAPRRATVYAPAVTYYSAPAYRTASPTYNVDVRTGRVRANVGPLRRVARGVACVFSPRARHRIRYERQTACNVAYASYNANRYSSGSAGGYSSYSTGSTGGYSSYSSGSAGGYSSYSSGSAGGYSPQPVPVVPDNTDDTDNGDDGLPTGSESDSATSFDRDFGDGPSISDTSQAAASLEQWSPPALPPIEVVIAAAEAASGVEERAWSPPTIAHLAPRQEAILASR